MPKSAPNLWTETYRRCHANTARFTGSPFTSWPRLENSSSSVSSNIFEDPSSRSDDVIDVESPDGFVVNNEKEIGSENKTAAREAIKRDGLDAIALYAPVHFFGVEHWGIYIHERRFYGLCAAIVEELGAVSGDWDAIVADVNRALIRHEFFHASVELFSLIFEDFAGGFDEKDCAYNSYFGSVYKPSFPTDACTEEGLATAAEFRGRYRTKGFLEALSRLTANMPDAYSQWTAFRSTNSFSAGLQTLATTVREKAETLTNSHARYPKRILFARLHSKVGNLWFSPTTPPQLDALGPVPRWIYRSGGVTSSRTLPKSRGRLSMAKFLKTLKRKYGVTLQSDGRHPKIVFPSGQKVTYSHSANEVADYLIKEISAILGISRSDLIRIM